MRTKAKKTSGQTAERDSFHARLRQVIGDESETSFSKRAGIAKSGLNRILRGGTPTLDVLIAIAETADVSIDWLATGHSHVEADIPVLGFAECGMKGWYNEVALKVSAYRIPELGSETFAVIAVGDSMRPAGIEQGFLCYCDPQNKPAHLDAVYLRRKDGSSSLKIYGGEEEGWLKLQGWLKPDASGVQAPYIDNLKRDLITQIAPVVYIKRKL